MEKDWRVIPQGDFCGECLYWNIIKAQTIPGGVPSVRCEYLDVENDGLLNDSIKICDVDIPKDLPDWLNVS